MRFHKNIEPEEKDRLENLVSQIKNCVEKKDYEYTEQLGNKSMTMGEKIYKVEFGLKKEKFTYMLEITKLNV